MILKIFTFRLYLQNHDHKNKIFLIQAESLDIKWKKPKLNCGIKATKELVLLS